MAGLMASYLMGARRSMASHVLGSTAMFINVVNAMVAEAWAPWLRTPPIVRPGSSGSSAS